MEQGRRGFQSGAILTLARVIHLYTRGGERGRKGTGDAYVTNASSCKQKRRLRGMGGEKDNLTIHDVK